MTNTINADSISNAFGLLSFNGVESSFRGPIDLETRKQMERWLLGNRDAPGSNCRCWKCQGTGVCRSCGGLGYC